MKRSYLIPILLTLFIIGISLRLYHLAELTDWSGDSGGDLLVARNILYFGHRPLVGPFLTVQNFFLPPIYFYLLAGILWVVRSPLGVVCVFFILNICSGLLLGTLVSKIIDSTAGVILFGLFTISATMVEHGRSFYQPYLLEPFFILCLYLFWVALRDKKYVYLFLSLISFSVAASIYPSPWLLLPYIIFLVYQFLQVRVTPHVNLRSVIMAVCLLFVTSIPVYIPQFVYEYRNGFPTLGAIFANDFGGVSNVLNWPQHYLIYLYQLINQFIGIEGILPLPYSYYAAAIIVVLCWIMLIQIRFGALHLSSERTAIYRRAFSFVDIRWYIVCILPAILFWENAYHRLWVYLPILFLFSTLMFRLALETRNSLYRICAGIIISIFVLGNVFTNWYRITNSPKNSLGNTESAALYILSDVQRRGIANHNYGVLYYTPYGYGNYNLATIVYFLQEHGAYPVSFLKAGNDIDRYSINVSHKGTVYLICRSDIRADESLAKCNNVFLGWNPSYALELVTTLPLGRIFIYTKR